MKLGFVVRTTLIHPATLINRFTPTFVFFILFCKLWHEFRIKCWNIPLVFLHYTFAWFWGVPRGLPIHIPWICNKSTIRECEFFWSPVKSFARQSFWITNVEPDFKISCEPSKSFDSSVLPSTTRFLWILPSTFFIDYKRRRTKDCS